MAKRQRRLLLKAAVILSFFLALLLTGLAGRNHARRQAILGILAETRRDVQGQLDRDYQSAHHLAARMQMLQPGTKSIPDAISAPRDLLARQKAEIAFFLAQFHEKNLSSEDDLALRLCRSTLANAEGRFADSLQIITEEDETRARSATAAQSELQIPILQLRGDAYSGLGNWSQALNRYVRLTDLQPEQTLPLARLAACQSALGQMEKAKSAYEQLSALYKSQGDAHLRLDRPGQAAERYEQSLAILTQLGGIDASGTWNVPLAEIRARIGHAQFLQGDPSAAAGQYETALSIRIAMPAPSGHSELLPPLAETHQNLGDALLAQGQPETASTHYLQSIHLQKQIRESTNLQQTAYDLGLAWQNLGNALMARGQVESALTNLQHSITVLEPLSDSGHIDAAIDLARSLNNRGIAHRAQSNLARALESFDEAIQHLTALGSPPTSTAPEANISPLTNRPVQVKLTIAMGYTENAFEALLRTRLRPGWPSREQSVVLGVSYQNRGYTRLVQEFVVEAAQDFEKAREIFARLVEVEGEEDLAPQFSRVLAALAWIYATSREPALRDGHKAQDYALAACEKSEWKTFGPVESLAAARAELGHFPEAVALQQQALEAAPAKYKEEVSARLALYKSGKPFRK